MARKSSKQNIFQSKWILIAVAFIVLFAVFYATYSKQNYSSNQKSDSTASETANWKTYELGVLTFKAPPNWWSNIYQDGILLNPTVFEGSDTPPAFKIYISKDTSPETLVAEVKKNTINLKSFTTSNIEIGGRNTVIIQYIIPPGFDTKDHTTIVGYTKINNDTYVIESNDDYIKKDVQKEKFDQILSTFRFTQ